MTRVLKQVRPKVLTATNWITQIYPIPRTCRWVPFNPVLVNNCSQIPFNVVPNEQTNVGVTNDQTIHMAAPVHFPGPHVMGLGHPVPRSLLMWCPVNQQKLVEIIIRLLLWLQLYIFLVHRDLGHPQCVFLPWVMGFLHLVILLLLLCKWLNPRRVLSTLGWIM